MGLLFFGIIIYKITTARQSLTLTTTKTDIAIRGDIYSSDDFTLASSQKLYKVSVNTASINPDKKELFIKLFSIYSGIDMEEIAQKLKRRGYITLSYSITPNVAKSLKQLNSKLLAYDVFQEYRDKNDRIYQKMGLSVEVSGISRIYPYNDALEPVLGYVQKQEIGPLTTPNGIKGVERYKNNSLEPKQNGIIQGKRDIGFNVIYDKNSKQQERQDGDDIRLTINLRLQKKIDTAKLLSALDIFTSLEGEFRYTSQARIIFEAAVVKAALTETTEALPSSQKNVSVPKVAPKETAKVEGVIAPKTKAEVKKTDAPKPDPRALKIWSDVIATVANDSEMSLKGEYDSFLKFAVSDGEPFVEGDKLVVYFADGQPFIIVDKPENRALIKKIVLDLSGLEFVAKKKLVLSDDNTKSYLKSLFDNDLKIK